MIQSLREQSKVCVTYHGVTACCSSERSQHKNRLIAMDMLKSKLMAGEPHNNEFKYTVAGETLSRHRVNPNEAND